MYDDEGQQDQQIWKYNPEKQLPQYGVLVYVGRTQSGKTFMMKDHLYHLRKKFDIVVVMSGSKDTAIEFEKHVPALYIYDDLDLVQLEAFYDRQEHLKAMESRGGARCPDVLIIIDDLGYKKKNILGSEVMGRIFFNCRHANMLFMVSIQDCKLLTPALRQQTRQIFLAGEKNPLNRKRIFDAFNPCFKYFEQFDSTFRMCTQNFEQLVLENQLTKSDKVKDNVFHYKAKDHGRFKVNRGGRIWKHNQRHLDRNHELRSNREKQKKKTQTVTKVRKTLPI